MSEESKYYTPDISEFHVGFEFENNGCSRLPKDEQVWKKQTCYATSIESIAYDLKCYNDESESRNSSIRVKFLSREDIESLGWKADGAYSWTLKFFRLGGQIQFQDVEIEREYEDYPNGTYTKWTETKFDGKIKNKSELKKLMVQLGIL